MYCRRPHLNERSRANRSKKKKKRGTNCRRRRRDEAFSATAGDGGVGAGWLRALKPRRVPGCDGVWAPRWLRDAGGQPSHPRLLRRRRPLPPPGAQQGKMPFPSRSSVARACSIRLPNYAKSCFFPSICDVLDAPVCKAWILIVLVR